MRFPANFIPEKEGGFYVTFPDIPEALTQGDDLEETQHYAEEVLDVAMEFYLEDRRAVPAPSRAKRGQHMTPLPPGTTAKVLLLNEMLAQKIGAAELAERMGITPQEVDLLFSTRRLTRIDRIDQALRTLGKRLEVRVV